MRVRVKEMDIQNFKGIESQHIDFGEENLVISSDNGIGKSTIVDAFWWCLFNKNSAGMEKFNVRPLNKEGITVDHLEIKVNVTLDIDGKDKQLSKIQKQKWVKNRATGEVTLQGNTNEFEVDGYPVKNEKAYKDAVSTIVDEDLFKILTNPTCFPQMEWKKQREMLMHLISGVTDTELAEQKEEFAVILEDLKNGHSVDEMKAKFQKQAKELDKELNTFEGVIAGMVKSKFDIGMELSELELQKNALTEKKNEVESRMVEMDKQVEEKKKLIDGIIELNFSLTELKRKANAENQVKKTKLRNDIDTLKLSINGCDKMMTILEDKMKREKVSYSQYEEMLEELLEKERATREMIFDEESAYCELCGQKLPENKVTELKADFEMRKMATLADVKEKEENMKSQIDSLKTGMEKDKKSMQEYRDNKEEFKSEIDKRERLLSEIPEDVDISSTDEYKKIFEQIKEKEKIMDQMNDASDEVDTLKADLNKMQEEILEIEKKIALSLKNDEIEAEIHKAKENQRKTGQKKADSEKILYVLGEFSKFKIRTLEERIKEALGSDLSVKLFEQQMNGEIKETCELSIGGVPFGSLNNGHKIVAGLQIIKTLQAKNDIYLPVFIDNAESVNDSNLPDMDCQIIKLKVSQDKTLVFANE